MAKKQEKSGGQEREGISPALWLVPVVAVIDLLYYFMLSMGYDLPIFRSMQVMWYLAVGVQGVLLVVLAVSHAMDRRSVAAAECEPEEAPAEEPEEAPATRTKAPARPPQKVAAPKPPEPAAKPLAREVFEFPPKVSGGIYADSHIPIGDGRFLKLRTQIARACLLCDEQGKCWDIVRTDVDEGSFYSNIDCKEGLKIAS